MSIAIDASTPAPSSTWTSNTFSPPAGSLIVVAFGNYSPDQASPSDSIGLTWSELVADNNTDEAMGIWSAPCPSAESNMTVSANASGGAGIWAPIVLTGAAQTQSGNATAFGNYFASGSPSVSVTTTAPGSWVLMAVGGRGSTAPVPTSGQTDVYNGNTYAFLVNGGSDYCWAQWTSSDVSAPGTLVTMAATSTGECGAVVAEILAAGGGGAVPSTFSVSDPGAYRIPGIH